MEKDQIYYWRDIPHTKSCSVPSSPLPPSILTNITVSTLELNRTTETLHMVVSLSPPDSMHGVFRGYELILLSSRETCVDCEISQGQRFLVCSV